MLKSSEREVKIIMMTILRNQMRKMHNTQDQIRNASREIETIKIIRRRYFEIKITVTEMKNAFEGFIRPSDSMKNM